MADAKDQNDAAAEPELPDADLKVCLVFVIDFCFRIQ